MRALTYFFLYAMIACVMGCTSTSENLSDVHSDENPESEFHFGPGPEAHFHFGPGPNVEWRGENAEAN